MPNWNRLARLASIMRTVANTKPKSFDISAWFADDEGMSEFDVDLVKPFITDNVLTKFASGETRVIAEGFCGTTQCVLGHAALDPEFHKDGLIVATDLWNGGVTYLVPQIYFTGDGIDPENLQTGTDAGAAFFELKELEAKIMFGTSGLATADWYSTSSGDQVTALDVAERLEKAVAEKDLGMADIIADYW